VPNLLWIVIVVVILFALLGGGLYGPHYLRF
jgi:predicted small lipoprotein YifL